MLTEFNSLAVLSRAVSRQIQFVTRPRGGWRLGASTRLAILVAGLCIGMAPLAAMAQDAPALPLVAKAAAPESPETPITALDNALIKVMQAGHAASFAQRAEMLRPVVKQTFDLPLLLRNSVGNLRWPAIPDDQKATLLELFEQFTIASYVANFDAFNGEKFVITPPLRKVEDDIVVPTRLLATNGDTTKLDYVLRLTDGTWRIVDILLDGTISRVAVTRSDFRALLAPGDASKLIESLRGKIANLTNGTAS
jgi:phospholipid transport system substrate-binding protein